MRCVTPCHHRSVHKAVLQVWSKGDSRQLTIDNTWRWLTCSREIIVSSEVWKSSWGNDAFLKILEFCSCLINILQLQGALSTRPEALDPVEAWPQTLCIGLKSSACNDCIELPPWSKKVSKYLFIYKLRNNSTNAKLKKLHYNNVIVSTVQNPYAMIAVIKLNKPCALSNLSYSALAQRCMVIKHMHYTAKSKGSFTLDLAWHGMVWCHMVLHDTLQCAAVATVTTGIFYMHCNALHCCAHGTAQFHMAWWCTVPNLV